MPEAAEVIDLAIVGGGAAGISAAREAKARGLSALVLEATSGIGGRARSVDWHGDALDLGATWLHSAERSPLVPLAEQLGVAMDRTPTRWREQYRELGISNKEQAESRAAIEAFAERLRSDPPASDRASDALQPNSEWNGALEALSGFLNGTGLANVSAADFTAYWDGSGEENWRLPNGVGSLLGLLGSGLDIRTECAVRKVELSAGGVRLVSERGILEAKRAIIAIPTSVLAAGAIDLPPAVGDWLHTASQLPLGHVEKMFFDLSDPEAFPPGAHLLGSPRSADTGSYILRPMGMPVIEAFFGGDWLTGLHAEDLFVKAQEELGNLLGSDFGRGLHSIAHSDWQRHPFVCGSYSYAKPGQHGARAALAKPVNEWLAFAGEACSEVDYATVHGAWASGQAAVAHLFGDKQCA